MRRISPRIAYILFVSLSAACAGGDSGTGPSLPPPPITAAPIPPGLLTIDVTGLPGGSSADISVTGGSFSRSATGPVSWVDVPAGQHTISVRPVRTANGSYAASPATSASFVVTVISGSTPTLATITYAPLPSALDLAITGVPGGSAAPVTVTAPGGSEVAVPTSRVLANAGFGRWRVTATTLSAGGFRYAPAPAQIDTTVLHGDTAKVSVRYAVSSGALAVAVTGLPPALTGSVTITGPDDFRRDVTATTTVTDLSPGSYRVIASSVSAAGIAYRPLVDTLVVAVTASLIASPASVSYAAQVGRIAVTTSGLPVESSPTLTLTGNGLTRALSGAATVDSLPIGSYALAAAPLTVNGVRYAPALATQNAVVTTGATSSINVAFAVIPTVVEVPVAGLPNGTNASISLTAPSGEVTPVVSTTRVSPAWPGRWRLSASAVTSGGATYLPTPASRDSSVIAGDTLRLPVQYTITTGSIAVVVGGLPDGSAGNVTVTGPGGFTRTLTGTSTITLLTPGSYTLSAAAVSAAGSPYVPSPASQQITVSASLVAAPATVTYAMATGNVAIAATGLPGSVSPTFSITGPGTTRNVTGAATVSGLQVGAWTLTAGTIVSGSTTYTPSPASRLVTIAQDATVSASFAYTGVAAANYAISNVYFTQAIQKLDGTVRIVAGRDALLRVFVVANAANAARPDVRVSVYDGTTLLQNTTITAPETSVRTAIDEGTLASTWNVLIPGANIRTTSRVLVELDPTLAITDADRADNTWPTSGTAAVSVSSVPAFNVRFVPIVVGALTGNVSAANKASFLSSAGRMFPLNTINSDVRAPFTSSATEIQSSDGNGQWLTVLSEINALRTTDGAPSTMHYYGVLKVSYTSGIAGYGYVPGRTAIGWDHLPSGDRVAAHEWGHNFSRQHAPCGTSGDASYPYAGGIINSWGWSSLSNTLVPTTWTDVMGYCGNQWISDYNWSAVMQYRSSSGGIGSIEATTGSAATTAGTLPTEGLLVWGRVSNGRIQLEPAFRVRAPATVATAASSHRLELLDADGNALIDTPIQPERVDHAIDRDERQFAAIVPWTADLEERLVSIRVRNARSPLSSVVRRSASMVAGGSSTARPSTQSVVEREPSGRTRVTWNSADYPMAMVRDAATGALMGFVRRSGDGVVSGGRTVSVVFSDGVRTVRQ